MRNPNKPVLMDRNPIYGAAATKPKSAVDVSEEKIIKLEKRIERLENCIVDLIETVTKFLKENYK